jgi:hypothetical protein
MTTEGEVAVHKWSDHARSIWGMKRTEVLRDALVFAEGQEPPACSCLTFSSGVVPAP